MTDFFDVLEQQLVAAHRRPERRRFVAVPWRATIVFAGAVAAAAVVVIAVLALSSPSRQPAASSPPTQPPQTTPVRPPAPSPIAVINETGGTGLAASTAEALTNNGYRDVVVVTNDGAPAISNSGVSYEPGHRELAQ